MPDTIPYIPTHYELLKKIEELECENEMLGRRYESLCKIIRQKGKDKVVDDHDKFLFNYAKGWDRL